MCERLVVDCGLREAVVNGVGCLVVPLMLRLGVHIGHVCGGLCILAALLAVTQQVLECLYSGRHV